MDGWMDISLIIFCTWLWLDTILCIIRKKFGIQMLLYHTQRWDEQTCIIYYVVKNKSFDMCRIVSASHGCSNKSSDCKLSHNRVAITYPHPAKDEEPILWMSIILLLSFAFKMILLFIVQGLNCNLKMLLSVNIYCTILYSHM